MIRSLQSKDMNSVMDIWLRSNIQAHSFIPKQYWLDHFDDAGAGIRSAEVFVYEDNGHITGFVGLNEDYIEGIFVSKECRSLGMGTKLLDFVKKRRSRLTLNVYCKNTAAVSFYEKNGFKVRKRISADVSDEYLMIWEKEI